MNGSMRNLALVVAGALLAAGCAGVTGRTAGQYIDDKMVNARVKGRVVAEDLAAATRVNVDAYNGTVYLAGIVGNEEEKRRLAEVAGASGHPVVNNLQVRGQKVAARAHGTPSASPSTGTGTMRDGDVAGMVSGEVTDVDRTSGKVTVRTSDGTMDLQFPPAAVRELKNGDRVRVGLMREGGAER
jgi:hypothetical protein